MAITPIAITPIVMGTPLALPAYTDVVTVADGASIDLTGSQPADVMVGVKFSCSDLSAAAVSINAGGNPPAFRNGLGNIIIAPSGSAANAEYLFSVGDSARIMQTSGKITLSFDGDVVTAASVRALKLPR